MNVTTSGRTCQVWAAQQPHEHTTGTELGEHNYCRDPHGDPNGVWCFTTDPDKRWEYCSVPTCGSKLTVKVLDFSADDKFTGAYLEAGFLPESFTICSAIMVDAWTTEFASAEMFIMYKDDGYPWGKIILHAFDSYSEYLELGRIDFDLFFNEKTEVIFFCLLH